MYVTRIFMTYFLVSDIINLTCSERTEVLRQKLSYLSFINSGGNILCHAFCERVFEHQDLNLHERPPEINAQ